MIGQEFLALVSLCSLMGLVLQAYERSFLDIHVRSFDPRIELVVAKKAFLWPLCNCSVVSLCLPGDEHDQSFCARELWSHRGRHLERFGTVGPTLMAVRSTIGLELGRKRGVTEKSYDGYRRRHAFALRA